MERLGSPPDMASVLYVRWEEVNVSTDKGRREVHYYLKRMDGGSDLAVIGKEKSLRHISYYYAIRNRSLLLSMRPPLKLKSRREVIDWLTSLVSESVTQESSHPTPSLDNNDVPDLDLTFKDIRSQKLGNYSKELLWLGSPWTCRKKRKHYQSFHRNGVKISVYDFVYVLAEEDKRLVAYLEDMYEDSRGSKMVVVRWFHKIDEVGIMLPHNFNDREIFFSLCLQDLSIECIDGLATVLSPQHFQKFLKEASHTKLVPYVCWKQFEDDDIKPFDITQVKGYWKQEIMRYMYGCPSALKDQVSSQISDGGLKIEGSVANCIGDRPNKRFCQLKNSNVCAGKKDSADAPCMNTHNKVDSRSEAEISHQGGVRSSAFLDLTESKQSPVQHLKVGCEVEVLCQDSGIRGCWFRAIIIKKYKDKVKVRYQDINDADDEAKKLEEWILASRVAIPDELGIRIYGRTIVRPPLPSNEGPVPLAFNIGTTVDAWWHDAWWEGIIVRKAAEDRIHVYFPGQKLESVFGCCHLRHSQEWLGYGWKRIKDRPNILSSMHFGMETNQATIKSEKAEVVQISTIAQVGKAEGSSKDYLDVGSDSPKELGLAPDLSKDNTLNQLRWRTSKKRKRSVVPVQKSSHYKNSRKGSPEVNGSDAFKRFLIPTTFKVDRDNCKIIGDSLFTSAVGQPLTSLVMSR